MPTTPIAHARSSGALGAGRSHAGEARACAAMRLGARARYGAPGTSCRSRRPVPISTESVNSSETETRRCGGRGGGDDAGRRPRRALWLRLRRDSWRVLGNDRRRSRTGARTRRVTRAWNATRSTPVVALESRWRHHSTRPARPACAAASASATRPYIVGMRVVDHRALAAAGTRAGRSATRSWSTPSPAGAWRRPRRAGTSDRIAYRLG